MTGNAFWGWSLKPASEGRIVGMMLGPKMICGDYRLGVAGWRFK